MKTSEGRKNNIEDLTEALEELRLAQIKASQVLGRISEEDSNKTTEKVKRSVAIQKRELDQQSEEESEDDNIIPGTVFRVEDRVIIINPAFGQKKKGIITGYNQTRTHQWIWVQPSSGPQLKRIAKNSVKF